MHVRYLQSTCGNSDPLPFVLILFGLPCACFSIYALTMYNYACDKILISHDKVILTDHDSLHEIIT